MESSLIQVNQHLARYSEESPKQRSMFQLILMKIFPHYFSDLFSLYSLTILAVNY